MAVAGTAQLIGLGSSMAASFLSGRSQARQIEALNKSRQQAWDTSLQIVRDQLSIAYDRTQINLAEINRDRLRNKVAIRAAAAKEKGVRSVKAAQLGIAGTRGMLNITKEVARGEAEAISDTDIEAEVQMQNTVNAFNDSAKAAVANLNASAPVAQTVPSTLDMLSGAIGTGVKYVQSLSETQYTDLLSNFNTTPAVEPVSLNITDAAPDYSGFA